MAAEDPYVDPLPGDHVVAEPEARRYPSTIGGVCYLLVLIGTGIGIGVAWSGDWRRGVVWIGGSLIVAAAIRLVLPRREAGMLAVRNRAVDATLLATVGGALIFLAETIPTQFL